MRRLTDTYAMAQYAYESMMLGHALIHYGYNRQAPKKSDIHLAWSRDGFHYERLPAAERGRGLLDLASIPADQQKRWVVEVPQGAGVIVAPGPRTNQTLILHAGPLGLRQSARSGCVARTCALTGELCRATRCQIRFYY